MQLSLGGKLLYIENYIPDEEGHLLIHRLKAELEFKERTIRLFGKDIKQPRLIAWAGDHPYTYSGDTLAPRSFAAASAMLLQRVNALLSEVVPRAPPFNHILANLYRSGQDSMGLHSDNETALGGSPIVASLSLGATRKFIIRPKKEYRSTREADRISLSLAHGSLLFMFPPMQRFYLHGIPKEGANTQSNLFSVERLNITLRAIQE